MIPSGQETPNKKEFDRLDAYAHSHADGVLTPVIMAHWKDILRDSGMAWEYYLGQMEYQVGEYKPMPAMLEGLLPPASSKDINENALKTWDKLEQFLKGKGLKSGDLEYLDAGREAIVFKVKKAPDILLKIGVFTDLPQTWLQLSTVKRHVEKSEEANGHAFYVSIVPYLGEKMDVGQLGNDPTLHNIPLRQETIRRLQNIKLDDPYQIEKILKHSGIEFLDKKHGNMRAHTDLPNLFLISDRRAIGYLQKGAPVANLAPEEQAMVDAAKMLQGDLQEKLKRKYGYGDAIFNGLAHQAQGKPIKSNYIENYSGI